MDRTLKNYVVPAYLSCLHGQAGSSVSVTGLSSPTASAEQAERTSL